MENFEAEKRRTLGLCLEERRKNYRCGANKYLELKDIPTWPEYYKLKYNTVKKCSLSKAHISAVLQGNIYKPDMELNEKVSVYAGDITRLEVDAIVNATHSGLYSSGGVGSAIHRAAGTMLSVECKTLNGCISGDAKITGGYNLPARYVIHTVGPTGEKPAMLESCYRRSIQLALENNIRTVAFPCIATGGHGYPNEGAVQVAIPAARTLLESYRNEIDRIIFCIFLAGDLDLYHRYMPIFFPVDE